MTIADNKGIVLVVDDSTEALGMLNEALTCQGYTVFVAMDGVQALAVARQMLPDIILMDAMMPNMDGFEACRSLKADAEMSHVPVIFMTGLSEPDDVVKGLEAGGVDYVIKPVNLDELHARIKVHLQTSRLSRTTQSALEELGQGTFVCDMNGHFIWMSNSAREYLSDNFEDNEASTDAISEQIKNWLGHSPDKYSKLSLKEPATHLQIRYLSRQSPGEYLFRFQDDDEQRSRDALKEKFQLTSREAEVLFWLTRGKTNQEIAEILSMSPRTVNKHLESVFRKMSVENRTSAAATCLEFLNSR